VHDYGQYPGPKPTFGEVSQYGMRSWLFPYLSMPVSFFEKANDNAGVLKCPAKAPKVIPGLFSDSVSALMYYDVYGYNQFGTDGLNPQPTTDLGLGYREYLPELPPNAVWRDPKTLQRRISESEVRVPSDMAAMGDAVGWGSFICPSTNSLASYHDNGANMTFCDAHVEYAKQAVWVAPKDYARKRWNNDNQPHSETW